MPETQVYTGQLKIEEIGVKEAVTGLGAINAAATKLKKSLSGLKISSLSINTAPINDSIKQIRASAQQLPDIVYDIQASFKKLPDKTSPHVLALADQFRAVKKKISSDLDDFGFVQAKTLSNLDSIQKKILEVSRTDAEFISTQNLSVSESKLADLRSQFDSVRSAGEGAATSISERLRGANLALTTSGSRLQGLREAMAGTTSSTNFFVKSIDNLIQKGDKIGQLNSKLEQQIGAITDSADKSVRALRSQADVFKQIVTEELGGGSRAAEEFNKQITRTNASLKQIAVTARSGGDISRGIIRAKQEIQGLRNEYELLRSQGIIKAGTQSDKAFQAMIADAETAASKVQAVSSRYRETKKEIEKVEAAQKEQAETGEKQVGLYRRISNAVSGMFGHFRRGKPDVAQITDQVRETTTQIQEASKAASALKGAFAGGAIGAILGNIIGDLVDLKGIASEISDVILSVGEASRKTAAALGLSADQAGKFGNTIRNVYGDNFGDTIGDVGEVVQTVSLRLQRFGELNEDALTRATENAIRLRDTYRADVDESIDAAAILVQEFGMTFDQAFDFISKGYQKGLNASGDFLDSIREYSVQFSSAGADAGQFFSLMDSGLSGGVLGIDKATDTFKEFRGRIQDGSVLTANSLTQLGLSAEELSNKMASGQINAAQAFQIVLDRLQKVDDENIRMQAGVGLLGTQYEDLGRSALNLSLLGTKTEDLAGATAALDLQYVGIKNTLQQVKRNFLLAFNTEALKQLGITLGPIFMQIVTMAGNAAAAISNLVTSIVTPINEAVDAVLNGTGTIDGTLQNLVAAFVSLIHGDFSSAVGFIGNAVVDALNYAGEVFNSFVAQAPDFGFAYIAEVANGMVEAANSILAEVMNSIGEMIASFMAPGSPPEQGPLSTINKWGIGLMSIYSSGMGAGIAKSMNNVLDPLADAIKDPAAFAAVKDSVTGIFDTIARDGEAGIEQVNAALAKIDTSVGDPETAKLLKDQLKSQVALQEQSAKIVAIKKEIADAEAAGYVPASLKAKLKAAEAEEGMIEDVIKAQDELMKTQKIGAEDTSDSIAGSSAKAAAAAIKSAGGAAGASIKAAKKMKKAFAESYQEEAALLEDKFARGLISEEEYLKKRISLEQKWFDSVENMDKDATAARILEMQAQLEAIKPKGKGALVGIAPGEGSPLSIFPSTQEVADGAIAVAKETTETLTKSIGSRLKAASGSIFSSLLESVTGVWGKIREFVSGLPQEWIFPFSVVAGIFAAPVIDKVFAFFTNILPFIGKLFKAVGALGGPIKLVTKLLLRWSIAGFIVYGIITRWDEVVEVAKAVFASLAVTVGGLISRIVEMIAAFQKTGKTSEIISNFGKAFSNVGLIFTQVFGLIKKVLKSVIFLVVGVVAIVSEFINILIDEFGGADEFGTKLADAMLELSEAFLAVTDTIVGALSALFAADFNTFLTKIQSIPQVLKESLSGGAIAGFLSELSGAFTRTVSKISQVIIGLIPPQVLEKIYEIRDAFRQFFQEGRLGGELVILFQQLGTFFQTVWPNIKFALIVFGVIIAGALAIAADVILSFIMAVVDALPFIERALAGVIRAVTGVVQIIQGVAVLFQALWAAITGDTESAKTLLTQALSTIGQGFSNVFAGIYMTVVNAGLAIIAFITSFVADFITNITMFIPGLQGVTDGITSFKDNFINNLIALSDSVVQIILGLSDQASTIFGLLVSKAIEIVSGLGSMNDIFISLVSLVVEAITGLNTKLQEIFTSIVSGLVSKAYDLYNQIVGNSIIPDMVNGIITYIGTLPEKLLALGGQMIQSFIAGIKNNFDIEGIKSLISSIFGGQGQGQGEEIGGSNPLESLLSQAPVMIDTFNVAFKTLEAGWLTLIANATTAWSTFLLSILTSWSTNQETMTIMNDTFIVLLKTKWTMFVAQFTALWQAAIKTISQAFEEFGNRVKVILQEILDAIVKINEAVTETSTLAEAAAASFGAVETAINNARDAVESMNSELENTLPLLKQLIEYSNRLAAAIQTSLGNISSAGNTARVPGMQGGAWRTPGGPAILHPNEMVLPAGIADSMRSLLTNLGRHNIGNMNFNPNVDLLDTSLPRTTDINRAPIEINPEFHTIIYGQEDEELFRQKVLDWVLDATRQI